MAVEFARETLTPELLAESMPLLKAHWAEVAHFKDIPLDPDEEGYLRIQDAGFLRVFTARDPDRRLVGYVVHFVTPNLHYRGVKHALQDVVFVAPEYRHGGMGMRLIAFADSCLAAEGVVVVCQHIKAAHNFGPMLERLGYELVDLIFQRRLDTCQS
jgi:GNAT superfamily N-acetyltransferase